MLWIHVSSSKELKVPHGLPMIVFTIRSFHPQRNWKVHSLTGSSRAKGWCFILKGIERYFLVPLAGLYGTSCFILKGIERLIFVFEFAFGIRFVSSSKELKASFSLWALPLPNLCFILKGIERFRVPNAYGLVHYSVSSSKELKARY